MFFVRVNRFWCVWTRVLGFADAFVSVKSGPMLLAMGCLT
jgi:hypothetical protein